MFKIESDQASGIITISVEGFWTVDEVGAFTDALQRESMTLREHNKQPALLYDYTKAVIQSQEVVQALSQLARSAPAQARKVAVCTEGQLAKRQASRVAAASDAIKLFEDQAAARQWLSLP